MKNLQEKRETITIQFSVAFKIIKNQKAKKEDCWRISKNIVKMEKVQKIGVMWGVMLNKGSSQLRDEATDKKSFNFHLFWFDFF